MLDGFKLKYKIIIIKVIFFFIKYEIFLFDEIRVIFFIW